MKTTTQIVRCTLLAASLLALSACANMSAHDQNMVTGAGIGAVAGAVLTGGSAIGTVGGAAVGGIIGDKVKR